MGYQVSDDEESPDGNDLENLITYAICGIFQYQNRNLFLSTPGRVKGYKLNTFGDFHLLFCLLPTLPFGLAELLHIFKF